MPAAAPSSPKAKRRPRAQATAPTPSSPQTVEPSEAPKTPQAERVPNAVPSMYADQVMDIVYGLHTSKIVFGVENGVGGVRPVAVVVVPTASLLHTAANVIRDLTAPNIIEETSKRMDSFLAMMNELKPRDTPTSK